VRRRHESEAVSGMDHGAHNRYGDLRTICLIPPSSYDSYQMHQDVETRGAGGDHDDSKYGDLRAILL